MKIGVLAITQQVHGQPADFFHVALNHLPAVHQALLVVFLDTLPEYKDTAPQTAGNILDGVRQARDGFPNGGHPLGFQQLARFFIHQLFQVFGVFPDLAAHRYSFPGPAYGNAQHFIIDRFGDKIGGVVFQTLNRQIHIPLAGEHDYFHFPVFFFDLLQQLDSVHVRHLDVGEHDGRSHLPEDLQRFLSVTS